MFDSNRLDQVDGEAGLGALSEVVFHAEAAEGEGAKRRVILAKGAKEVEAGAIGKTEIGDEEIEGMMRGEGESLLDIGGDGYGVADAGEQAGESVSGGGVVFDNEDVNTPSGRRGRG